MSDRYDIYDDYDAEVTHSRTNRSTDDSGSGGKKKRSLLGRFLAVFFSVLFLFIFAFGAYIAYKAFKDPIIIATPQDGQSQQKPADPVGTIIDDITSAPKLNERTNFLILGTDEDGSRTDTILLCCFNATLNELSMISIPRDTLVEVSDETFNKMISEFPEPGQKGMKINEIYHYGGKKEGINMLKGQIESMFGISIDYYVLVSFDAFDYLVDSVGGVEYNVPIPMDYEDPYQNLAIHLAPGLQVLNGEQAEGLVRFRSGYSNADLGRIETQQNFIKVLLKKLTKSDVIFANAKDYIYAFFKYVDTDVSVADAIGYVSVFKKFDANNLYTYTLPGDVADKYGFIGGYGYYPEETRDLSYEVFKKPSNEIKADRERAQSAETASEKYDDTTLDIQVLNGGYTDGMAAEIQKMLNNAGYNVTAIDTWTGNKSQKTNSDNF